ncbi:hypothetical protein P8C59_009250 [Phyllachora maydis]|uniref:Uncharacterized protein n=1 Tax=Phyllachora maydis TaxID=1825666 RepID=A0AAD9IC86_9PEZI|nr:hypothetical protein P8C59_009250 [Phyllachora maydis]
MSYYDNPQWTGAGQAAWDHQSPPPARSGASSALPREEATAFAHQLEEVDRAVENLMKSGKMFGQPGARRESLQQPSPSKRLPDTAPRMGGLGHGARPMPVADFNDTRGPHPGGNLQNFFASQRHQPSRGSNEAEHMSQAKRRMAAQRERELRNYHQEQQFHRTVLAELSYSTKSDRTMSPGNLSEGERRDLIARQRSVLFAEGSFSEQPGYVDESGAPRAGIAVTHAGPSTMRNQSPLAYDYGRAPSTHAETASQPPAENGQGMTAGPHERERERANSNASPQSNPSGNRVMYDAPAGRDPARTSASSPGGSPPRQGVPGAPGTKPTPTAVAPIGTRPAVLNAPVNPALTKRSTTPLPSLFSQGYTAPAAEVASVNPANGGSTNPNSASTEGPNVGALGGGWSRSGVWGSKSGLGVQASVWG